MGHARRAVTRSAIDSAMRDAIGLIIDLVKEMKKRALKRLAALEAGQEPMPVDKNELAFAPTALDALQKASHTFLMEEQQASLAAGGSRTDWLPDDLDAVQFPENEGASAGS